MKASHEITIFARRRWSKATGSYEPFDQDQTITVDVEVDTMALARQMAAKAFYNKSKSSSVGNGAVIVRVK